MDSTRVAELQQLIGLCKSNPALLHDSSLAFFKDYLQSLGGSVPEKPGLADHDEDEIIESDLELDGEIIDPDDDPPQKMGDPSVEISEERCDAAQLLKSKAMQAVAENNLEEAIDYLTEAILLYPSSAILYAARARVFVKMRKGSAAIRDADTALKINPNSATGYKSRGMAWSLMAQWEAAASDLRLASKLDYDEEIYSILTKAESNVRRIEEHRNKYERLRKEKEARRIQREKHHQSEKSRQDPQVEDPNSLAVLRDGEVISTHSSDDWNRN
ncbi:Hsp70-interacting protein Hip/Transient component of progesterone receptor complexes and an Hsp70-binding protein [Dioscorea alata]|uniref:Hsp70-interacting protein Hip/Transient component of progesterone receptor complexes and an Hsp70-binding protein n=1 Tax=Dioscorea alata TaxID=55571 RepID=A0ACB7U6I9_DIOAL|nr:Hsp70-interacting protein Hip/Transient component of progesterone receptor complexes and an Hsp70-binding protein [Dioscorea alata]